MLHVTSLMMKRYEVNWIDKTQMSCLPSLLKVFKPNVMDVFRIMPTPSDHFQNLFNDSATCLINKFHEQILSVNQIRRFLVLQPRLFQGNKRFFGRFVKFPKLSNICSKKVISTLCKIPSCHLLFEPKNPDSNRIQVHQLKL